MEYLLDLRLVGFRSLGFEVPGLRVWGSAVDLGLRVFMGLELGGLGFEA